MSNSPESRKRCPRTPPTRRISSPKPLVTTPLVNNDGALPGDRAMRGAGG